MKNSALKNLFAATIALVVAALLLLPRSGFAQTPFLHTDVYGNPPTVQREVSSTTATYMTDDYDAPYGIGNLDVRYGSAHSRSTSDIPQGASGGPGGEIYNFLRCYWVDAVTVSNPALTGQSGVARFTMHLTGGFAANITGGEAAASASYQVTISGGGGVNVEGEIGSGGGGIQGTPPSALATFTCDVAFTYGSPSELVGFGVSSYTNGGGGSPSFPGSATASADFTLGSGNFIVLNAQNQPTDFTAESGTGSARGSNIAPGAPYNTFTLTNNAPDRLGTTMSLRDGTASAATNVTAAFVAPPPPAVIQLASDAVDLSGTGTDPVVIQMSYDPATAQTLFGGEAGLRLGCELAGWVNAISGNTGGDPQFFARAYNPATDFHVGYYGLDTVNHLVWAVCNHNSKYGVTVVPDLLTMTAAVSRKTHGGAGPFDINLPLTGTPATECRTGGAGGDHTLVLTFTNNVVSGNASVTAGSGSVAGIPTFAGNTMTVNLTGVTDAQSVTVTLASVTDSFSQVLPSATVSVGFLLGDTNGDHFVNAGDSVQTRSRSGQPTGAANFRSDVNLDGFVNSGDAVVVRARSGTFVP